MNLLKSSGLDALFLVGVVFASVEVAGLSYEVTQILGALAFSGALFCTLDLSGRKGAAVAVSAALATTLLAPLLSQTGALLVPIAWALILHRFGSETARGVVRRCLPATTAYLLVLVGVRAIPELHYGSRQLSHRLSAGLEFFGGEPFVFGPSVLSLNLLLMLIVYGLASVSARSEGRPGWLRCSAAVVFAVSVFCGFHLMCTELEPVVLKMVRQSRLTGASTFIGPRQSAAPLSVFFAFAGAPLLPVLGVIAASLIPPARGSGSASEQQPAESGVDSRAMPRWRRVGVLAAVAGILLSVGAALIPIPGASNGRDVIISPNGRFTLDVPSGFKRFGGLNAGMFGLLPKMLQKFGYDVTVAEFSEQSLADKNVAILINRREPFDEAEIKAVRDFVRGGGSLILLVDHTRFEAEDPVNELLQPCGIQVRFDTVKPLYGGWKNNDLEFMPGQLPVTPRETYRVFHWVGASWDVDSSVRPVLVGRYALSDIGNESDIERNKLGDYKLNPGEQIGDQVLVATTAFGDGQILAFADTSSFQNLPLIKSWEYVSGVMRCANREAPLQIPTWICAIPFLVCFGILTASSLRAPDSLVGLIAAFAAIGVVLCADIVVASRNAPDLPHQQSDALPLAVIGLGHTERLTLESEREDSIVGLSLNAMRNGFVPIVEYGSVERHLDSAEVVLLSSPAKEFSAGEVERLHEFVSSGGTLVLSVGFEESESCSALFRRFEVSLGSEPLGKVQVVGGHQPTLREAWPVICDDAEMTVHADFEGTPICVERRIGSGRFFFAGDTYFLQAQNLETFGEKGDDGRHRYHLEIANVHFLRTQVFKR